LNSTMAGWSVPSKRWLQVFDMAVPYKSLVFSILAACGLLLIASGYFGGVLWLC
jgi:hypothetical protein